MPSEFNKQVEEECCQCRYYFDHSRSHGGDCRRFPPVFSGNEESSERHRWKHPLVMAHNWRVYCQTAHTLNRPP
jgi:hypothetical protein